MSESRMVDSSGKPRPLGIQVYREGDLYQRCKRCSGVLRTYQDHYFGVCLACEEKEEKEEKEEREKREKE